MAIIEKGMLPNHIEKGKYMTLDRARRFSHIRCIAHHIAQPVTRPLLKMVGYAPYRIEHNAMRRHNR